MTLEILPEEEEKKGGEEAMQLSCIVLSKKDLNLFIQRG
jgi:hypothetical protein